MKKKSYDVKTVGKNACQGTGTVRNAVNGIAESQIGNDNVVIEKTAFAELFNVTVLTCKNPCSWGQKHGNNLAILSRSMYFTNPILFTQKRY